MFDGLREDYEAYSFQKDYKGLVDQIKSNRIRIASNAEKRKACQNAPFPIFGKKIAERYEYKNEILSDEIDSLTSKYIRGFVDKYELPAWLEECGMDDVYSDSKFLGSFDIDKLPPSAAKVNSSEGYINQGIIIPSERSEEFRELCTLAYKYLSGTKKKRGYARKK